MVTLHEARLERLMSVHALARAAGVSPTTVHEVEHGRRLPLELTIRKLAIALSREPGEIVEFKRALEAAAGRAAAETGAR